MPRGKPVTSSSAPKAIGPYSQAIAVDKLVFLSGQIALDPQTGNLIEGSIREQAVQVFENLSAVAQASGGTIQDAVKLTVYLTDLGNFPIANEVMSGYFTEPYPARATVQVSALPRNAVIEIDAILALS